TAQETLSLLEVLQEAVPGDSPPKGAKVHRVPPATYDDGDTVFKYERFPRLNDDFLVHPATASGSASCSCEDQTTGEEIKGELNSEEALRLLSSQLLDIFGSWFCLRSGQLLHRYQRTVRADSDGDESEGENVRADGQDDRAEAVMRQVRHLFDTLNRLLPPRARVVFGAAADRLRPRGQEQRRESLLSSPDDEILAAVLRLCGAMHKALPQMSHRVFEVFNRLGRAPSSKVTRTWSAALLQASAQSLYSHNTKNNNDEAENNKKDNDKKNNKKNNNKRKQQRRPVGSARSTEARTFGGGVFDDDADAADDAVLCRFDLQRRRGTSTVVAPATLGAQVSLDPELFRNVRRRSPSATADKPYVPMSVDSSARAELLSALSLIDASAPAGSSDDEEEDEIHTLVEDTDEETLSSESELDDNARRQRVINSVDAELDLHTYRCYP
ncbi:MAG: hypothetical protein MHM6MM_009100, partial [Cercozoa sp. M6MM]